MKRPSASRVTVADSSLSPVSVITARAANGAVTGPVGPALSVKIDTLAPASPARA